MKIIGGLVDNLFYRTITVFFNSGTETSPLATTAGMRGNRRDTPATPRCPPCPPASMNAPRPTTTPARLLAAHKSAILASRVCLQS